MDSAAVKKPKRKRDTSAEERDGSDVKKKSVAKIGADPARLAKSTEEAKKEVKEEEDESGVFSLFVSGLPYESSEADIRSFFTSTLEPSKKAALPAPSPVAESSILEIRAPVYHDTGRLKGYAHIDVNSKAAMELCLARDGRYLKDRFVQVEQAKDRGQGRAERAALGLGGLSAPHARPPGCVTLFVKGLPYEFDEDAVGNALQPLYGRVVYVRLARHNQTGKTKGFGYVQFEKEADAEKMMAAFRASAKGGPGVLIGGRSCICDWDPTQVPKASFRDSSGRAFSKTEHARVLPASSSATFRGGRGGGGSGGGRGGGRGGGGGGGRQKLE
jgi:RNA recognition motif-containing protein